MEIKYDADYGRYATGYLYHKEKLIWKWTNKVPFFICACAGLDNGLYIFIDSEAKLYSIQNNKAAYIIFTDSGYELYVPDYEEVVDVGYVGNVRLRELKNISKAKQ